MAEQVGQIYYDVTLDTGKLLVEVRVVNEQLDRVTRQSDKLDAKFNALALAAKALAAAFATIKAAQLADEIRLMASRVEVAAGSLDSGVAAMAQLIAISRNTQTAVSANVEVFSRLNQSLLQMGGTQADTLRITELLGKAIKVSGASAVEAKSAMLQFGQALGSGKLQGDELRSLMENAPYLMRQLADGIGVPVGALKKLGEEGKLTSDVVVNALGKAATQIESDFSRFPQTVAGAFQVAMDAAERANEKLDQLAGTSQLLTGASQGLGQVLDKLADQFGSVNAEAGTLGRNAAVKTWADQTRNALSYVIDAADMVWQTLSVLGRNVAFVFTGIGTEIGGIGAQIAAVMRGDFAGARAIGEAMTADAQARRAKLDAEDAKTLAKRKLFGEQMREAWEQGAGGGRGSVNPTTGPAKLKPTPGSGDTKKTAKFDADGYMAGLSAAAASEWDRIDLIEKEALRKNAERLKAGQITKKQSEEAVTLIAEAARQDRQKIMDREFDEVVKDGDKRAEAQKRSEEKIAAERKAAMEYGAQLTKAINPVDALRQELQAKLDLVKQYETMMAAAGVDATAQGMAARTQIQNEYEKQRLALAEASYRSQSESNALVVDSLNALSSTGANAIVGLINGTMSLQDVMRGLANTVTTEAVGALIRVGMEMVKNSLLASTLAASDKARGAAQGAVYAASVSAQVAGMTALAAQNAFAATAAIPIVGPGLAPAAAVAAGAAAAALGAPAVSTAPLAGARQYGGSADAGRMYRVNETGAPEMFTGSNGQQYLLPTKSGSVTPADQVGGNVQWVININNTAAGVQAAASVDQTSRTVEIAVSTVASQIANNEGKVWSALKGSTNVRGAGL
ncbi:tape measure protein [Xylophilus sp. GOD-11R]|uniref:tape measure protein n=1 Tax=Xylophilus sp. GOD-11R TaxID=3089814 RepID=UPI00298D197F|nr:tape measure protein [Xylophilus sp. GOD-11R]WPB58645.1 tape measure protein [Xylophilus sp. GOD-11R]